MGVEDVVVKILRSSPFHALKKNGSTITVDNHIFYMKIKLVFVLDLSF